MKERSLKQRKDKGFTLVELIVVLVILAILAAILIPALLGYLDKAKEKQKLLDAKNCLTAAQAELTELYAKNGDKLVLGDPILPGATFLSDKDKNGDAISENTDAAKKILETAGMTGDKAPYLFYIGVGSNWNQNTKYNDKVTKHDKYTVFVAVYIGKNGDAPLYYYEGKWTKKNPRLGNSNNENKNDLDPYNRFKSGSRTGLRIQYYMISNKTGWGKTNNNSGTFKSDFWTKLKDYQQKEFK